MHENRGSLGLKDGPLWIRLPFGSAMSELKPSYLKQGVRETRLCPSAGARGEHDVSQRRAPVDPKYNSAMWNRSFDMSFSDVPDNC